MQDAFVSFRCDKCRTEIEASPDMIGQETECPACGAKIVIPEPEADDVVRHVVGDDDPRAAGRTLGFLADHVRRRLDFRVTLVTAEADEGSCHCQSPSLVALRHA